MSSLYGPQHQVLQEQFDSRGMAERVKEIIVAPQVGPEHQGFIESRDFFFLSSVDHRGFPTVSHKGGHPGFVRVPDPETLVFPSYDGNGMFLSMGNIAGNPKVGLLFIDFETPHRVRVHGEATVTAEDPQLEHFPGAELLVRVRVHEIWVNCPRYIHRYQRVAASHYVPCVGQPAPPAQWKRINALQDVLPARDQGLAERAGGVISPEQYGELVMRGEG